MFIFNSCFIGVPFNAKFKGPGRYLLEESSVAPSQKLLLARPRSARRPLAPALSALPLALFPGPR